MAEDIKEDQKF